MFAEVDTSGLIGLNYPDWFIWLTTGMMIPIFIWLIYNLFSRWRKYSVGELRCIHCNMPLNVFSDGEVVACCKEHLHQWRLDYGRERSKDPLVN